MPDDPFADIPYTPNPLREHIERNESRATNLPPTANYDYPRSHASGLAQFQPKTWQEMSRGAGVKTTAREAYEATPDQQRAVENYALKTYGPNATYTWAASAPRGGYRDSMTAKDPFADIPVAKGQGKDPFADIPIAKPQPTPAVVAKPQPAPVVQPPVGAGGKPLLGPPAPTGQDRLDQMVRGFEQKTYPGPMGPPQRPPGPDDPSQAARAQQAQRKFDEPDLPPGSEAATNEAAAASIQSVLPSLSDLKKTQLADVIGNTMDKGFDLAHDAIVSVLKQPLPGIAPNLGMSDTHAHQLARDILLEVMRRGGEGEMKPGDLSTEAVKPAAAGEPAGFSLEASSKPFGEDTIYKVKDADGRQVATLQGRVDGKDFKVNYIAADKGPNQLGPSAVRGIQQAIKTKHPEIESISGFRRTGARGASGAPGQVSVTIPPERAPVSPPHLPWETGEAVKLPAIKTPEGKVVEGPHHDAIENAGTTGEPGFTTSHGRFVGRKEAADIARTTGQSARDVDALHSEDLKPGPPPPAKPISLDEFKQEVEKVVPAKDKAIVKAKEGLFAPDKGKAPLPPFKPDPLSPLAKFYDDIAKSGRSHTVLPMDMASRTQRAQAQGFNTKLTLYHGTGSDFFIKFKTPKSSEPAIFLSDDPGVANAYSQKGKAPGIIPIWARIENPKTVNFKGTSYSNVKMAAAIKTARAEGHDVLIVKNVNDIYKDPQTGAGGGKPQTQYAFFKPENLRAKFGAAFDPDPASYQQFGMLGADATQKAVMDGYKAVPPVPTKAFIGSTDDSFFRLRQAATADQSQFSNYIKALPPELKDPAVQKRMYEFMEGGTPLNDKERALYDKYVQPLKHEEKDLYDEIKKIAPDIASQFDPDYVHRMVKGKSREYDPWMGEAGDAAADPVGGYRSTTTGSLKERVYYAIENQEGRRKLIAATDKGSFVINKGEQPQPLPRYAGQATKLGDKFSIGPDKWEVKQARTSEIEAHTELKYYQNALASTIKNVTQLRAVARSVAEINRLKSTPEWAAYTRPLDGQAPRDWRASTFPLFRDRLMDPKLANVIDDFWGNKKMALGEKIAAINRISIGSLFWSPVPHALNAGAHWVTARGWDWLTPQGYRSLAVDTAKAVREVVTQGPEYQRMLREGSGLIYGSVANDKFYRNVLQSLGESVQREPWKWDPIARAMGVGPSDLVKMLYGVSSRALWSTSDVFMMQRVFELERKGVKTRDAIGEAEKHIPNYRIPPEVLGSRQFASALKDPSLTAFSRYHYGMFKSYANMARDLAVGAGAERFKAMGNVFATAVLGMLVWPQVNRAIQNLTGDKKLELGPKGSLTIPYEAYEAWNGKPINQVIQNSITLTPIVKGLYEGFTNRDWFTGRNIVEPADQEKHRFGRVAGQVSEKVAQDTLAPYGVAAQASGRGGVKGAAEGLIKQGLGLRKPFQPYHGKSGSYGTPAQQANYRRAHPRGPIEALEKKAEHWLKRAQ